MQSDQNGSSACQNESDAELESWWSQFIEKKQSEDAIYHELCSTWENYAQRRQKFAREIKQIFELYQPIKRLIDSVLGNDKLNRGATLYKEWGLMGRKEYLLAYYDNDLFRAAYAKARFAISATSFLQALVYRIIPEQPAVECYLASHVSRVISIGPGPGPDIAAMVAYARTHSLPQRLVFYAIDQCAEWGSYLEAFDRQWSAEYRISVWFKSFRFGKPEHVDQLPDADMLVFCFANTALMAPSVWTLLRQRYRLIVVLDGGNENVKNTFMDAGFKDFTLTAKTSVYYHFGGLPESSISES